MSPAVVLGFPEPTVALDVESLADDVRELNALEMRIAATAADWEAMLWEQAARVVALLRSGMSQRALARAWINACTGRPYSQMHVSFTARAFEKFTFQPRPRFRAAYNAVANSAKRAENTRAHLNLAGADPDDADLRVCSCDELFATGIKPVAVITEPPRGAENLHLFSDLARACVDVPHVAVQLDSLCLCLPEVMKQLCAHLTYRGVVNRDNRVILVFCHDDDAFARAKRRIVPGPSSIRPYLAWAEYLVQRLADPEDLICDPFLRPWTAIAALEFGRRFVGANVDASVVADTQRQIGVRR